MDSNKLRRLAGIPVDLSVPANAKGTVRLPAKMIAEHAKVPQHRGELAPKTKDNMRARVNHAKKALEALEQARDELMDLPAVDYMEDIPTVIKQLHQILHGEDGTGGVHHLHRKYKNDFDSTTFPEDIEEEKRKEEEERQAQEAGITGDEKDTSKKKKTNESVSSNPAPDTKVKSDGLGFEKQKVDPSKENKKPFKLAPGSDTTTMYQAKEDESNVAKDPRDAKGEHVEESDKPEWLEKAEVKAEEKEGKPVSDSEKKKVKSEEEEKVDDVHAEDPEQDEQAVKDHDGDSVNETKKPKWLEKAEVKAEKKDGDKVSKKEEKKVGVKESGQGPLFARDAGHAKHGSTERYPSWAPGTKPVNVVTDEEPSIYYPNGSKNESPNQLATNPYNENQKVAVPAKIKNQLKEQAVEARKLAETFNMRKDWDSKNFHENLADAYETLVNFLNKETIYGIKEAQVFMTSLMSPMMNKIPPDVIKFIAAGGTLRSLKSYVNDVKNPTTAPDVFKQDSNGLRGNTDLS